MKVEAYQIGEMIHLKRFRNEYTTTPLFINNSELYYKQADGKFFYLFAFGVVIFAGMTELEKNELLKNIKNYTDKQVTSTYKDHINVEVNGKEPLTVNYHSVIIEKLTNDSLRIIMINIGQSVALDFYETLSFEIHNNTKRFAEQLERKGDLPISKKNLIRFIGRTLNVKHNIIDNLYIFHAPDIVWKNEFLETLDNKLKNLLDLKTRYRDVDYRLKIVQENLTLFTDLLQNRESNRMEYIITVLILIEVANLILDKLKI